MRFIFNRDFKDYLHHPEWISLDNSELSKNIWKKFGSRGNYLDTIYSNNWRIIFVAKNQILSEHETIDLLEHSFKQYFSDITLQNSFISSITEVQNINQRKNRYQDSISVFRQNLVTKSLLHFIQAVDSSIDESQISDFIDIHPDFTYKVPFLYSNYILTDNTRKNSWDEDSIEAFLRNNLLIQVKTTVLEEEGIAIAIFLRKDLKLGKGKSGAQISHGAISLLHQPLFKSSFHVEYMQRDKKEILIYSVKDLKDIRDIEKLCIGLKVNYSTISDAGHTQIEPGTVTCVAVGPLPIIWLKVLSFNLEASDLNT